MNGYTLTRAWFDWAYENPEKNNPTITALYLWLVEKWNRCGQKEKMSITTAENMAAINILSRHTHNNAFKKLTEYGFIKIIRESKNQFSCNIISLVQITTKQRHGKRTALDMALIQAPIPAPALLIKQVNKETSKQVNNSDYDLFVLEFRKITGKEKSTGNEKTKKAFMARINEGRTLDDFVLATQNCFADTFHKENPKYLTIEFITRPDKLEKYLNATPPKPQPITPDKDAGW